MTTTRVNYFFYNYNNVKLPDVCSKLLLHTLLTNIKITHRVEDILLLLNRHEELHEKYLQKII